jgi:SprT protein
VENNQASMRTVKPPVVIESLHLYAQELLEKTYLEFPIAFIPLLEWRRLRVTAGLAYFEQNKIALSAIVLVNTEQIHNTLLHEYAHLLAYHRAGRKGIGHGAVWRQAMIDLGLSPKIHHQYEVQRNESKNLVYYQCKRCGYSFSRKRKLARGRKYYHVSCGGLVQLSKS